MVVVVVVVVVALESVVLEWIRHHQVLLMRVSEQMRDQRKVTKFVININSRVENYRIYTM